MPKGQYKRKSKFSPKKSYLKITGVTEPKLTTFQVTFIREDDIRVFVNAIDVNDAINLACSAIQVSKLSKPKRLPGMAIDHAWPRVTHVGEFSARYRDKDDVERLSFDRPFVRMESKHEKRDSVPVETKVRPIK